VTSSQLVDHVCIHTGEKKYKCDIEGCPGAFAQHSTLSTHKKSCWYTEAGKLRNKKKEEAMSQFLCDQGYDNVKREHWVGIACVGLGDRRNYRIDFLIQYRGIIFCIECDENGHNGYELSCETARMNNIMASWLQEEHTLQPVVFIRFNPDKFTVDGVRQKVDITDRFDALAEQIETFDPQPGRSLTIVYMFYNSCTIDANGTLLADIILDPEYDHALKECCVTVA
jgi:hypothetical protein